jgi:hypothetical protein
MNKIVEATCSAAGIVTIDGKPISEAVILSEGNAASEGIAMIEGETVTYVTSNATDIKDLITDLESIIQQVITVLTAANGGLTSPGALTAGIASLTTLKTQFGLKKDLLK